MPCTAGGQHLKYTLHRAFQEKMRVKLKFDSELKTNVKPWSGDIISFHLKKP